ncbi:RNA polymerase sigma factor [Taibaiella soli]|uniref:RNA polymerase sigma factor n=1 Tax=Taibaiella soli TaxID=1649169 RepID=A0A2W2B3N6_9BACT|nr:RNA polymerase sigma factor [Taibaiella soli]PZF74628.1 RNA polymerase subunit sigma [Taibaiella soli]
MNSQIQDNDIIQQVLNGQKNAYAILVDRYKNYVFTLVLRYVNNRETAEELAQDVFVKAFRSLVDFKGTSKFSTWLYTIVNTTCLSYLRKKQENVHFFEEADLVHLSENRATADHLPLSKQNYQLIQRALEHLPAADAQLLQLFYLAEQRIDEIVLITGISANTVKVKLHRARNRLKDILEQHFKEELETYR